EDNPTPLLPHSIPTRRTSDLSIGCDAQPVQNTPIVRDVLDNGLRILTERMTQVRSISIGVWLTRGSRHETAERSGIAHFVEHMRSEEHTSELQSRENLV